MGERANTLARRIKDFVENPVTNLVKGVGLMLIGISDASHTFHDDLTHGQVRVGHGLIIIGLFSILEALPHSIEGLAATSRYLESRGKGRAGKESGRP